MGIGAWLRELGLGQYEAAFRENEIDETVLPNLTQEDLKEMGVGPVGQRDSADPDVQRSVAAAVFPHCPRVHAEALGAQSGYVLLSRPSPLSWLPLTALFLDGGKLVLGVTEQLLGLI
jgi:hypothetical protein